MTCSRLARLAVLVALTACGPRGETASPSADTSGEESAAAASGTATEVVAPTYAAGATEPAPAMALESSAAVTPTETPTVHASAAELPSASEHPASATMRAQIAILERQSGELEQVASQIAAARDRVSVGPSGVPPICEDRSAIEALRIVGTSGSAGASAAISAVEALDDWCEPFEQWMRPDERSARQIRSYLQHVEQIVGWLRDLRRCESTTGAERARCENAYSDVQREAAEEAGRGLALLELHLRELGPVQTGSARFPCTTPTLARMAATTWVGSVARAQLASLSRAAMTVCDGIGVADADLREGSRRVLAALDRAEASARAQRRNALEAMESLRPYVE